jgi:hypothetical protein
VLIVKFDFSQWRLPINTGGMEGQRYNRIQKIIVGHLILLKTIAGASE